MTLQVRIRDVWQNTRLLSSEDLLVYAYHRVCADGQDQSGEFDDDVVTCDVNRFQRQLEVIAARRRIVSMDEIISSFNLGTALPRKSALLTFDDGYIDNYTVAFPVLKRMGLTACFFLPTVAVVDRALGWWDQVAFLVKRAACGSYELRDSIRFELRDSSMKARQRVVRSLISTIKANYLNEVQEIVLQLSAVTGIAVPTRARQSEELMTLEQVRIMISAGMTVGSHSCTHRSLAHLTEQEQLSELNLSREILQGELQCRVDSVAYPYGGASNFNEVTKRAAKTAGFSCGFCLLLPGSGIQIAGADPLALNRIIPGEISLSEAIFRWRQRPVRGRPDSRGVGA